MGVAGDMTVEQVMRKRVHSCRPDQTWQAVHSLMREFQVRRLPVVDGDGRPGQASRDRPSGLSG